MEFYWYDIAGSAGVALIITAYVLLQTGPKLTVLALPEEPEEPEQEPEDG